MAELGVSREVATAVLELRRSELYAERSYSLASFAFSFGSELGFPKFSLSQLELSVVTPLERPLCIEVLLRLLAGALGRASPSRQTHTPPAAEPPRLDKDGAPPPLQVPEKWESSLAALLEEEEGVPAEDSWLGCANPLEGGDVFSSPPAARFQLLVALCERMLLDDVVTEGPSGYSPLVWAAWHGQPVGEHGGFRYWVVPGECRVWRETAGGKRDRKGGDEADAPGAWDTPAVSEAQLSALITQLAGEKEGRTLSSALQRGCLAPLAKARAAAEEEAAAAVAAEAAEQEAILLRVSRSASLRSVVKEEADRREVERAKELRLLHARRVEAVEERRRALKRLIPARLRTGDWEARLVAANAQPGEPAWRAPPVGGEALGRDVSVWWTKEKEFFPGTVTAWEEATGRATVTFWDGDVETYKLEEEQVAWH